VSREDAGPGASHLPGPGQPWTPIRLTRWSGEYLRSKGVGEGRLDAELLLAHVLGISRLDLYLQHDRPLRADELAEFKSLLKRRATREPLQYVIGGTDFRELHLRIDARALIPRPETEVLVGEVLTWASERQRRSLSGTGSPVDSGNQAGLTALEVGTGSGAIALSLLKEGPFRWVVATDSSARALDLARENASLNRLLGRLDLREGSFFEPLGEGERFDVIVSNPPYVPEGDRQQLQEEVRDWEPPEALFAGSEGLDVLLPLLREAPCHLSPRGLLALEVGEGQDGSVSRALEESGRFEEIRISSDLAGRKRVVQGVASE
jgi:release factor glutamine methyltransferase